MFFDRTETLANSGFADFSFVVGFVFVIVTEFSFLVAVFWSAELILLFIPVDCDLAFGPCCSFFGTSLGYFEGNILCITL